MKRPVATGDGGPTQNAKRAKRAQEPSDAGKFTDVSALRALSDLLGEPMTAAEPAAAPPRKRERGKKKKADAPGAVQASKPTHTAGKSGKATDSAPDVKASGKLRSKKVSTQVSKLAAARAVAANKAAREAAACEPAHVEGVFLGDVMYLKDPATGRVFGGERGRRGELVHVGSWDEEGRCVRLKTAEDKAAEAAEAAKVDLALLRKLKAEAQAARLAEEAREKKHVRQTVAEEYNFGVDPEDHCETSTEAYADARPFLMRLCHLLEKSPAELRIYDPYFCAGSVHYHLGELGFSNVINRNEDFYAANRAGTIPEYDVLVTNPPYSEDHVERCLAFCMRSNKPWLVLLPNYVAAKPYYAPILAGRAGAKWGGPPADLEEGVPPVAPFYVVPKKRYNYWSPKGIDRYNPRVRKDGRTSPFITFWYMHCQEFNGEVLNWWTTTAQKKNPLLRVYRRVESIPEGIMNTDDAGRLKTRGKNLSDMRTAQKAAKAAKSLLV